ncbi:MAG: cyclase family protein [Pirellulaceae bacterium]|nr:cyclase family protein [Pirellulaceae bacterium]
MSPLKPEIGSTTTLVPANPSAPLAAATMIDLTHSFDENTIFWPTEEGFQLEQGPAGFTQTGYFYAANRFRLAEHGGTHIDAPIHFFAGGKTVDEIPLHRLIGDAVIIDVTEACKNDRDYQIGINDFRKWETTHERQLVDVIVLLRTGFGRHWPDREKYLGTAIRGEEAVRQLHFPGLSPDAAKWLVENRMIKAIGIDTASIDHGQSTSFGSHVTLFEKNIPAFENVANLDELPLEGFNIIALPMKIRTGTGGPLRIIALLDSSPATLP